MEYLWVIVWAVVTVLMVCIEFATVSLVSIWFAAGALAATITALLTDRLWIQLLAFVVVTVAALIATRPLVKKLMTKHTENAGINSMIGISCIVTEPVGPDCLSGRVKVGDVYWNAVSKTERVSVGEEVKVIAVEGNKLFVEKK